LRTPRVLLPPCVLVAYACSGTASAEPFVGQFELKTLDAEPGAYEFQSQNAWSHGRPPRAIDQDDNGELLFDENSVFGERYALELEMGLTASLKMRVGVEFERERIEEPASIAQANDLGSLELGELGAELIAVLVPRESDGTGFGLVVELEGPPDQEEPNHLVLGSIFEYQSGRWFAAAVPMLVHSFGGEVEDGERRDDKWDFAYASQLMYRASERWAVALEGYGTIERLWNTGHRSETSQRFGDFDQHRLGVIVYYAHQFGASVRSGGAGAGADDEGMGLSIGFGVLEGLNEHTADHTIKLSIEIDF